MNAENGGTITLLIADDHPVVRDGLRGILEPADGFIVLGEVKFPRDLGRSIVVPRERVDAAAGFRSG